MDIYKERKGTPIYKEGRELALKTYHRVWGTKVLQDKNEWGVIIKIKDQVIGNANLAIEEPFQSEEIFGGKHWLPYFVNMDGEVNSLALSDKVKSYDRKRVIKNLMIGIHDICMDNGIGVVSTVQHTYLATLLKAMEIPLILNKIADKPLLETPADKYWSGPLEPRIYYVEPSKWKYEI